MKVIQGRGTLGWKKKQALKQATYLRKEKKKKVILEVFQHFQASNTFNMMSGLDAFQVPMCLSLGAPQFV